MGFDYLRVGALLNTRRKAEVLHHILVSLSQLHLPKEAIKFLKQQPQPLEQLFLH